MKRRENKVEETGIRKEKGFDKEAWKPKTDIGIKVKAGQITDIDTIINAGVRIMEPEIVDCLLPNLQSDLFEVGQSKGKFGGGKRSIWRTTQKKSMEGNKPSFTAMAVVGDKDGHVGIGMGKAKETMPAKEKAIRQAKLHLISIKRGCGSWACGCREAHSIPFTVSGKNGSSEITLIPAPKGTGLCAHSEAQRMLALAGVKDVYSKKKGQTVTRVNVILACFAALKKLGAMKIKPEDIQNLGIVSGKKE
jgi:small subunit ribosomal protein S5